MEDLLQKHSLQEADIAVQAERVESLNKAALKFTTIEGKAQPRAYTSEKSQGVAIKPDKGGRDVQ